MQAGHGTADGGHLQQFRIDHVICLLANVFHWQVQTLRHLFQRAQLAQLKQDLQLLGTQCLLSQTRQAFRITRMTQQQILHQAAQCIGIGHGAAIQAVDTQQGIDDSARCGQGQVEIGLAQGCSFPCGRHQRHQAVVMCSVRLAMQLSPGVEQGYFRQHQRLACAACLRSIKTLLIAPAVKDVAAALEVRRGLAIGHVYMREEDRRIAAGDAQHVAGKGQWCIAMQ